MFLPWLDTVQSHIASAAGFGSFLAVLFRRAAGWRQILLLFMVGQMSAFFFTVPLADWRGWSMAYYGVLAFTIGAFAMVVWGTLFGVASSVQADPQGTLTWAYRLWRGGGNGNGRPPPNNDNSTDRGDG